MRIYCIFLHTRPVAGSFLCMTGCNLQEIRFASFLRYRKAISCNAKRDSAPSFHLKQNPFSFTFFNFLYVLLYNHFQYNAYNRILNHFQRRFEDPYISSYNFLH